MHPPRPLERADYLVVESTYGDRRHPGTDAATELADIVTRVSGRGGTLVIPSFAVGRAQIVLHLLTTLMNAGRAPKLPVFLDSPMAINATELFCRYHDQHRLSAEQCAHMCDRVVYARTVEDSRAAIRNRGPKIVISASGMATGGRVLHHLKATLGDPRNCIAFVGFQATGTRGAALLGGAESLKIHGTYHRVNAEVAYIENLSAHADCDELIAWLRSVREPPRRTFVVHGEPGAQDALRLKISDELGWNAVVPEHREQVELE
jgi:metallo-beta-lactamase family protein